MPTSVHGATVFWLWKQGRWLGDRQGKHTSNIPKRFLCLATGKNLVCFSCVYVILLWSLEQRGRYKRKKKKKEKLLHLSSSTNTAWRLLCGDLGDWAPCRPVTHPGADGQWGSSPCFPPQPTLRPGTFSTSSSGKAGNWLFLWNEHDPEEHWAWTACALGRVLSCTSHHQASELLFLRGQPEPGDRRTATDLWQGIATLPAYDSTWEVREITFL